MSLSGAQAGKKEWVAVKALEEEHLQFNDFKSELVTLRYLFLFFSFLSFSFFLSLLRANSFIL